MVQRYFAYLRKNPNLHPSELEVLTREAKFTLVESGVARTRKTTTLETTVPATTNAAFNK